MGDVIKVDDYELCSICRKRQAKFLCDMPVSRVKNLHLKLPDGSTDYENSFREYTETCDKAVCERCSVEIGNGIHFCKKCIGKLKHSIE